MLRVLHISILPIWPPSREANGQVPGSVELRSVSSTQCVGGTLDVMHDQVPAYGTQIEVPVLFLGMPEHAAGIDFAFARSDTVDHGLFKLMVSVPAKHMLLPVIGD